MTFCLEKFTKYGVDLKRAEGRANVTPALDITRTQEVQAMPLRGNIIPCGDSATYSDIFDASCASRFEVAQ